ncbi:MAG: DUF29 domain-containing protein [Xenococcaceae cyanobacterium MO_188.B19]|nr:DUF29 domain-containing protein [Xenococcaceae cyanobacterium MO_188.B19]
MKNKYSLYEQDYNLWQEKEIAALKNRDINQLDWENLITEISEVGKSQKRALKNYTQRLIEHLLKIKYWYSEQERNRDHWIIEVSNFRDNIIDILEDSPSLKNYLQENYDDWYGKSVKRVSRVFTVPENDKIVLSELLSEKYFGD